MTIYQSTISRYVFARQDFASWGRLQGQVLSVDLPCGKTWLFAPPKALKLLPDCILGLHLSNLGPF